MGKLFENSLLMRLGFAMATITALGFITMLGSVIIVEKTQGEAAAINQAGSLRMQSHRIATQLAIVPKEITAEYQIKTAQLIDEFEQRLNHTRLSGVIPDSSTHPLRQSYDDISNRWLGEINPLLQAFVRSTGSSNYDDSPGDAKGSLKEKIRLDLQQRYLSLADQFVEEIDHLVQLLERDAENKIRWLRTIQITSLFLVLAVVFRTMYLMHTIVLLPLRELVEFAQRARVSDFSMRIKLRQDDELGQLGGAFNAMADDLSKIYSDLEVRVQEKTADLKRSNRSIELLYKTTRRLNNALLSSSVYTELLEDIEQVVDCGPGIICLKGEDGQNVSILASTRNTDEEQTLCTSNNCLQCMEQKETRIRGWQVNGKMRRAVSVPIQDQKTHYGILFLAIPSGATLENWKIQLLEAIAEHIGLAIGIAYQASYSRRLALHEERGVIARELHDSLAQSLSYLKIQISRLAQNLQQPKDEAAINDVVQEIREGLNSAYRQLRELLTTFRLQVRGHGLHQSLIDTIDEFNKQSNVEINLDNQAKSFHLTENEEIHVLQVIREALSNVLHHADATRAQVSLKSLANSRVQVSIYDDGSGIPETPERESHYGIAIMGERVDSLNGTLKIEQPTAGGTAVVFEFPLSVDDDKQPTQENTDQS